MISAKGGGYQAEKFTEKQVFHDNISTEELKDYCLKLIGKKYLRCNAFAAGTEFMLMISSKGKISFKKKAASAVCSVNKEHNRKKNYIIDAATAAAPLVDMGIFTKDGKVVNSMYDKYRQINRFIEIIDDEASKINKD